LSNGIAAIPDLVTLSRPDDEGLAAIPADEFTTLLEHENALAWHQKTDDAKPMLCVQG
jgi:hypothetical protein